MYQQILYEVEDPVATITLNRPERLNAWTERMEREVRHALAQAEEDPKVVAIILPVDYSSSRSCIVPSGIGGPSIGSWKLPSWTTSDGICCSMSC